MRLCHSTSRNTYRDEKDKLLGEKKDEDCCSKYALDDIQSSRCMWPYDGSGSSRIGEVKPWGVH